MRVMPRSAWTRVPRPDGLVHMSGPIGLALHWPGPKASDPPIGDPGATSIASILEAERRYHVEVHGWADIAYGAAVDQAGRVWDCRGLQYRSAANGDQAVNSTHGAVTCLLGPREQPSPAMVDAVRQLRRTLWLPMYPRALAVVGHCDLHSTDCPGPAVRTMIRHGVFTAPEPIITQPTPPQEDPMLMAGAKDTERVFLIVDTAQGPRAVYIPDPKLIHAEDRMIEFPTQAGLAGTYPIISADVTR
jgi:hypothetical protein